MQRSVFDKKIASLDSCLATRDGSVAEKKIRNLTYYGALVDITDDLFTEACDRLLYTDEWFPSIARIKAVVDECRHGRARTRQAIEATSAPVDLVCPTCAGARWVRHGGYDPPKMQAGEQGSRVGRCPTCCERGGAFIPGMERAAIRDYGGVPNPNGGAVVVDRDAITWPQRMDDLRGQDGRIDHELLYQLSRELRDKDPWGDDRPDAVSGFATIGRADTSGKRGEAA